ncbi:MAG: carbonic anhydrase [Sulfurospirillum sp.]|nr:MAG: carbonic anhydrase [Sulfurospirillum sp.]
MSTETLVKSYKIFKKKYGEKYSGLFQELVENGQSPKTLFIACSDSRVVPNLITYTKPGDLFISRNIGNFVPPFDEESEASATPAAIEYAVSVLNIDNIIVCGHTDCGACKSLHKEIPEDDIEMTNIRKWLKFGDSAKEQAIAFVGNKDPKTLYSATEKFNVIEQIKNLLTYPAVKRKVADGSIFIQGWYYHLHNGELEYFDPIEHRFLPITDSLRSSHHTETNEPVDIEELMESNQ